MTGSNGEAGQASLLLLGVVAALVTGLVVLFAFGQALGAKGRHQRAADLAAVSAAQVMRDNYARLFELPLLPNGLPNPRHLSNAAYLALARAAARRGAVRNGLRAGDVAVSFPGVGFAPTRVTVQLRGEATVRAPGDDRPRPVAVAARATAELAPDISGLGMPENASGGGYSGPLAYRQGKPMRPDVALAFDRLAAAARREAGLHLIVVSGFRSDAEQARLFAANPDPKWVAPPGQSLHRYGTELDLGPPSAYAWLEANAERFGFTKRYSWEPWHFGYTRNTGSASVGFGRPSGAGPGGDGRSSVPSFVPARFRDAIARAAQRRRARRGSPSSCPARRPPTGSATRSTPPGRSTPRRISCAICSAASARCRWRWRRTTPGPARWPAAAAFRRTRRRRPTWRRSSASWAAPATWPFRRSRSG
jgi:hypothetical protein